MTTQHNTKKEDNKMTNDVTTPKWYVFTHPYRVSLYGWFDSDKDAKKYEQILPVNFYHARPLDAVDFRKIAEERAHADDKPLTDTECQTIADEWLHNVCVMTSEALREYLRQQRNTTQHKKKETTK